ncbi:MAG: ABC-2 transporter permease [Longimicrobiales bacterium]
MSGSIIRRLVIKDLYLQWPLIVGAMLAGGVAIALLPRSETAYFVGWIALLVVLILLGVFTVVLSVIQERKDKVLLFVLSLPISTKQYVLAKLASNAAAFLGPWAILTATALAVIAVTPMPDGHMPFLAIILLWAVCYYSLLLGVALVTDSAVWTTVVIVACNIAPTFFIPALYRLPSLDGSNPAATAHWGTEVLAVLGAELALCVVAVGLGLFFHSRKRDFV